MFSLLTDHSWGKVAPWRITDRIHIGGNGGWDYLVVQPETNRLFVSHAKQVVVIDLKTKAIMGSIEADGVHGIALAPELNRGFVSNGAGNSVTVFDLTTLKVETHLPAENNPDAICYEPKTKRVFAFNGKSGTATVIDAVQEKVIGEIPLDGKPEFAQADGKGDVFDNLEDKSQIVKIDAAAMTITARWSLPAESEPSGLAMDVTKNRLFIGCCGYLRGQCAGQDRGQGSNHDLQPHDRHGLSARRKIWAGTCANGRASEAPAFHSAR